ncbi:DUF1675 domain-containing protein [Cephalotus follicularis]|uniref:Ninja-family protein n=1 Tax=Cephalotus follicularis TaxID=3775 RepID=A0A1Q3CV42_CEPFO|nr:DUF1675 domain-containing protein [Cephalotus follicularis]
MAQAKEGENSSREQHITQMNNFSRDLLQRFISSNHFGYSHQPDQEDNEEIELSLGLSLNGRFGIDPTRSPSTTTTNKKKKQIIRSSSIPDFLNPIARHNDTAASMIHMGSCNTNLIRTFSLPTETGVEWRKRKELQTLRRMEAKRKRSEKKKARDRNRGFCEENSEDDIKREQEQDQCVKIGVESLPVGSHNCVIGDTGGGFGGGVDGVLPQVAVIAGVASQGSIGSQGSASSGISEYESQPVRGTNKVTEARSPASVQSLPQGEPGSAHTVKSGNLPGVTAENLYCKPTVTDGKTKELMKNVLEDMPCVSTKGDGPNGKRIEGFLYRYKKGEEVRIVCVCHGSFLTPAEFVKHAGGGDVEHPLKHIVVSPPPFL